MITYHDYRVADPDALETPTMRGSTRGGGAAKHPVASGGSAADRVGGDARSVRGRRRQLFLCLLRTHRGHVRFTGDIYLLGRGLQYGDARHSVSLRCPDPDPSGGPVSGRGEDHHGPGVQGNQWRSSGRGKGLRSARTRRNSYCRTKSMEYSGSRVNCLVWATISWRCRVTFVPQRSATRAST